MYEIRHVCCAHGGSCIFQTASNLKFLPPLLKFCCTENVFMAIISPRFLGSQTLSISHFYQLYQLYPPFDLWTPQKNYNRRHLWKWYHWEDKLEKKWRTVGTRRFWGWRRNKSMYWTHAMTEELCEELCSYYCPQSLRWEKPLVFYFVKFSTGGGRWFATNHHMISDRSQCNSQHTIVNWWPLCIFLKCRHLHYWVQLRRSVCAFHIQELKYLSAASL